jgi:hypothetical protein
VFNNKVYNNDCPNFAPEGNIVAKVAQGTGIMVMANSRVEIFENDIRDHRTFNVIIASYFGTGIPISDPNYYPYAEDIYVHGNTFGKGGFAPSGEFGALVSLLTGPQIPDIVWDGWVNTEKVAKGELPANANVLVGTNKKEDGELSFANINAERALKDPTDVQVDRDLSKHQGEIPRLKPVVLEGMGD